MGRPARGVRAMTSRRAITWSASKSYDEDNLILSISENGFGKLTPVNEYRQTARGAKGVTLMKTTPRIGKVMKVLCVEGKRQSSSLSPKTARSSVLNRATFARRDVPLRA